MQPAIGLRDEQDSDEAFVAALYAGSRADEMARVPWPEPETAAFLRMQFALQRIHYRTHFADATFSIVVNGDVPIGRLYVQRAPDEIRLIEITLLPEWRGHGIGGALVQDLLNEGGARQARGVACRAEQPSSTLIPAAGIPAGRGCRALRPAGMVSRLRAGAARPDPAGRLAAAPPPAAPEPSGAAWSPC